MLDAITPAGGTNCKYTWSLNDEEYFIKTGQGKETELVIFKTNLNGLKAKDYEVTSVTSCESTEKEVYAIIYKFKIREKTIQNKIHERGFTIGNIYFDNDIQKIDINIIP